MPEKRSQKERPVEKQVLVNEDEFALMLIETLKKADIAEYMKGIMKTAFEALNVRQIISEEVAKQVKTLKDEAVEREKKITAMQNSIDDLEEKLDSIEQYSRRESLRFSGIPECPDSQLQEKVLEVINNDLCPNNPILPHDIARVHRIGQGSPRKVIVKFSSYTKRSDVFTNRKNLRKRTGKPIFVNEDLTKGRASLLYAARQEKKKKEPLISDCWTYDGRIMVKLNDNKGTIKTLPTKGFLAENPPKDLASLAKFLSSKATK